MRRGDFGLSAFLFVLIAGAVALSGPQYLLERRQHDFLEQLLSPPRFSAEELASLKLGEEKILNAFRPQTDRPMRPELAQSSPPLPPHPALYVGDPLVSTARLSPNGDYLSAVQTINNANYVVMYDLDGGGEPAIFNFTNLNVDWVSWAGNDRLLVGYSLLVAIQILDVQIIFGGSRVLAVNRDGTHPVVLFGGEPAVAANNFNLSVVNHLLPDDPGHILMSAYQGTKLGLWKVNIDSGAAQLLVLGNEKTRGWFANSAGEPILRIDTNQRATYARIYAQDAKNSRWVQISAGPLNTNRTPNVWPQAAAARPKAVYVLANEKSQDRVSMKLFDTISGEFLETVYEHPSVDVGGAIIESGSRDYLGTWFIEDRYNIAFKDKTLQAHYNGLKRFFENSANILIQNTSGASDRFLVFVSGPRDPGDYYIYDYARQTIWPLFSVRPQLPRRHLGRVDTIRYETRDGLTLTAYLTHPSENEDRPAPLVVMPHGGPEARDYHSYNGHAQFLASRGYRILQPNFRGSSGYGKRFAEAGYGEWGGKMQDDVADAVLHVKSLGLVRDDDVCIVGASYGGYAALMGAVKTPELYRCAVSVAGVSDLIEFLASERKEEGAGSPSYKYWVKAIGHPSADRQALKDNSPLSHAQRYPVPVMLAHGADDSAVPVNQSRLMRDALKTSGKSVRYLEFAKTGHRNWPTQNEVAYLNALEEFLDRHLNAKERTTIASLPAPAVQPAPFSPPDRE